MPAAPPAPHRSPAAVFAALGDETRLSLVQRLSAGGGLSIARLAAGTPVTRQAVTKHLHVLAGAGLVRVTRHGREQHWELEVDQIAAARSALDAISAHWDDAIERLRQAVE